VTPDASLSNGKTVSNRDVLSISSEGQKIAGSPATSTHESETKQPSVAAANQEELDSLVQALNQHMSRSNLRLRFGTDEESGLDYFQLYDRKNGDVVKQYPPEEVLELTAQLQDLAGTMFNQEA
jgi:flagellar protein FlaG